MEKIQTETLPTGAIVSNQQSNGIISHAGIAITFGLVVMAMIYALGDVSGAHMNPTVTIDFSLAKRFQLKNVFPYIVSLAIGALSASATLSSVHKTNF